MRRVSRALAPLLLVLLVLLAACGGSNPTATSAPSAAPSAAASAAASAALSAAPASAAASTSAAPASPTPAPPAAGAASPTRAASPSTAASPTRPASTPIAAPPRVTGKLTVFAAASLTDAFNEMKATIEAANPGTTITFNFAASSALRTQLEQGAKADTFASADTVQMDNAKKANLIQGDSAIFARNTPVIIVPANNPANITGPADLAKPGVKLVLAAPEVPIGNYARQVIKKLATDPAMGADYEAKALANLVSNEANVRAVLAKIQLGEGDAGIVYASDVTPAVAAQLKVIGIPTGLNVIAEYPVAVVQGAANAAGAQQFIAYLLSAAGQATLQKWGFTPVSPSGSVAVSGLVGTARSYTIAEGWTCSTGRRCWISSPTSLHSTPMPANVSTGEVSASK
jgi:molybdate transport system substrate-binding protein